MPTTTTQPSVIGRALTEFKESGPVNQVISGFFVFVPLAFLADFLGFPPLFTFFLAAFAVVPIAKTMGDATESLAHRAGPGIGGLLNATFGNAVELIISIIALSKGLTEVVKASITGSILGNILFVLGLAMFLGGLSRKRQLFNKVGASASASQMSLAAIALIIPAVFTATIGNGQTPAQRNDLLENLSLVVSGILLLCYVAQLIFFLRTHSELTNEETEEEKAFEASLTKAEQQILREEASEEVATWSVRRSIITLLVATVVVGFVSEILVGSIEPLTKDLGWTELFVGVILVAVIGNAAEHLTAVTVAMKNKMNLAMNISIGSSLQIAFFVAPVLVFVGFFTGHQLNLQFEEFELVSLVASILIVNLVAADGESNWFEGLQLLAAYLIIGVAFFLHP